MKHEKRNFLVGLFALAALVFLGWLIFRFQQFPLLVQRYNTIQVELLFPSAPGIKESTPVYFCGYEVGHVAAVQPPRLRAETGAEAAQSFQVPVTVVLRKDIVIPANIEPKVYRRGLGGSYIDLGLSSDPCGQNLEHDARLEGTLSDASEFISERTQVQMERLIESLTRLSQTMQVQLEPLSPEQVDAVGGRPNITTMVMRMDTTLRNLNAFLGDKESQKNFKEGLASLASIARKAEEFIEKAQLLTEDSRALLNQLSGTMTHIDKLTEQAGGQLASLTASIQNTAQNVTETVTVIQQILQKVRDGQGSAGLMINDPRLYETLTDAFENLDLTVAELRQLIQTAQKEGVRLSLW